MKDRKSGNCQQYKVIFNCLVPPVGAGLNINTMEYTNNRMTEKELVQNLLEIQQELHNRLRKASIDDEFTNVQELQLAAQIQQNLFLHQANFSRVKGSSSEYGCPGNETRDILIDINDQLESMVKIMEQKSSD